MQKLFEQKELSIAEPIKFYKFTLRLLYNSFTLSDKLYQQYKVMIQKYLKVDDQFFRQKDEWILPMIKNDLQIYYSRFLADRAKLFRRKIERCVTKEGISEPTRVCEFKTVGQNKLYSWIHNLEHDDNAKHLYSNWITSNVIKTKKKGKYWIKNEDGTLSNLSEEAKYLDIRDFFDKINFEKDKCQEQQEFFKVVLGFMHHLMFEIFSVNDSDVGIYFQKRGVNFNSFFMYCSREDPKSYDKNDKRCGMYGKFLNNEPSGYLAKILAAIPEKFLADKEIKQTIKKIADGSLKALDELDAEKCGLIFPYLFLKIYLYKKYDLDTSDHDKQILFNEFKKEINSIKNGLRKFNWPRNIIFEKQILRDIRNYFIDNVEKKEIADVVINAIIYCHIKDFSEDDFKWYFDEFGTDFKNETGIKVDKNGQPLKNLFLDETDSKIGYYKLKFIVNSNFIIFDKHRLNDKKFNPFSSEEFDNILNNIDAKITFREEDVQDGIFYFFCGMLKFMSRDQFGKTIKISFKIEEEKYLDFLYDKYMSKEENNRPDLKNCLEDIHDPQRSKYKKYKEELEKIYKQRKQDLEKKQLEEERQKNKESSGSGEDSESSEKEDSESESEKSKDKKTKKKNKKSNAKARVKEKSKQKKDYKSENSSNEEVESESEYDKKKKTKKKNKKKEKDKSENSLEEESKCNINKNTVKFKKYKEDDCLSEKSSKDNKQKNKFLSSESAQDVLLENDKLKIKNGNSNENNDESDNERDLKNSKTSNTNENVLNASIKREEENEIINNGSISDTSNKNKFLQWFLRILGCILFVLAFVLLFTLTLSLAVKIIISLAILILSVACFVIVCKIRRLEPPQNLNNGDLLDNRQSVLQSKQKENENTKNRASNEINKESKTADSNFTEKK